MDAKRYMKLKDRGLTGFLKKDEKIYLTFKRFATDDGHEIEPEEQLVNIPEIEDRIQVLSLELEGLKLIKAEVEKL